jgi:hypothetical protein
MSYIPGGAYNGEFPTSSFTTGAATDADFLPTAVARRNGTDDPTFVLTVTHIETGVYGVSGVIPSTYQPGDLVQIRATATVGGVQGKGVVSDFPVVANPDPVAARVPANYAPGTLGYIIGQIIGQQLAGAFTGPGSSVFSAAALANTPVCPPAIPVLTEPVQPVTAVYGNIAFRVGEDKGLLVQVFEADGTTPQNVLTWQGNFVMCAYQDSGTVYLSKPFSVPYPQPDATNSWLEVILASSDTSGFFPNQYSYFFERTNPGNDIVPTLGLLSLMAKAS